MTATTPAPAARKRRAIVVVALAAATLAMSTTLAGAGTPAAAACSISTTLRIGSIGDAVRCLQATLNGAGFASGPVDGNFGPMTRGAVLAYQRARGLSIDGVVGPQTGGALGIWGGATTPPPAAPAPSPAAPPAGGCTIGTVLRIGSIGDAVRCLQATLNGAGFASGPVDGNFGPMTRGAVLAYQRARGLSIDGVVGPQTGGALGIWGGATTPPAAPASPVCTPPAGVPSSARQVVVVTASGSRADVDLLVLRGAEWVCARTDMSARVGRNGIRALAERRSGDGTTPAGVFPLGTMTAPDGQTFQFFGNGADPGVPGSWRQVRAGDCWGATPGTPDYNRLVTRQASACTGDDEYLPAITGAYSAAALIGANMGADRSGDQPGEPALAAAIFLHRHSYDAAGSTTATAGCVSLEAGDLAAVLRQLVPGEAWFVVR